LSSDPRHIPFQQALGWLRHLSLSRRPIHLFSVDHIHFSHFSPAFKKQRRDELKRLACVAGEIARLKLRGVEGSLKGQKVMRISITSDLVNQTVE
jgi:hypothetical protein